MSQLQDKSEVLHEAADLLHQEEYYPAVAHSAYYSCLQLSKHIWLHNNKKTEEDLEKECHGKHKGSHEVLINTTRSYIKKSGMNNCKNDSRIFYNIIGQLKTLRVDADYRDIVFGEKESQKSISLSKTVLPILKKYLL